MILCDIGNTYIHFYDRRRIWKNEPKKIEKKELHSDIYYISVNMENEKRLLKAHKNSYNMSKIVELQTPYKGLGVDRKAACLGISDGVIIDAGSAITVDIMEKEVHLGGYILPGLASYIQAYRQISSALDKKLNLAVSLDELPLDTQSAIGFGILQSITSSINGIIKDKKVYFTGGDGKFLSKFFAESIYNEMLVFNGMQISIDKILKKNRENI
ncbi:type III pantothenate kinase [Helicobacter sp. 13S00477-4]|uniref:type III pantothenate kinase n=1 Tax=Helicobacter sp. 13S00477-4 TaxID=1905759 RepID=UPI000BA62D0E|nr:type III pantothenate kinase [Helicobacter sp. 13S00477-4]PAF52650.1 pantothenate kinase [Helicobacter sp. 13S00477-4]